MVLYETQNDLPLTEEEIKARDIMVNLFIPVLKFILSDINYNEFKKGDIIIIDEPEQHLSVPVIKELREFLKQFAKDLDVKEFQ